MLQVSHARTIVRQDVHSSSMPTSEVSPAFSTRVPTVTENSRPVHTPGNNVLLQWQALHCSHPGSSPCKEIVMTQNRSLRRVLLFLAIATFAIFLVPKTAFASEDDRAPYAIGLWGDLPYNSAQATVGVPNLIADMNSQNLAFTAHDGDLKSGSSECTDAVYTQALAYFGSLKAPAAFTPGDNDWTDCDRTAGYSSLAQLDKERALFF